MGFRFRHSIQLFPGVRLNFSGGGISTTVGVRGASINFGRRGVYANVGLPGTGLSYRTKISAIQDGRPSNIPSFSGSRPSTEDTNNDQQSVFTSRTDIKSASVPVLTSPGLNGLKALINEAHIRRLSLNEEAARLDRNLRIYERKFRFAQFLIVRLFMSRQILGLAEKVYRANLALNDAQNELERCAVAVDFDFDKSVLGKYSTLLVTYNSLCESSMIWDITTSAAVDRVKQRTTATRALDRKAVRFSLGQPEIVASKYKSLRLANANGHDMEIFPGFMMLRDEEGDFALIDLKDIHFESSISPFIEEEKMPFDSEIIGNTWKRANKDGSRDRRFSSNYQIPIAAYGQLTLRSPTGLFEAYQISNHKKAGDFAAAFLAYQEALSHAARHSQIASTADPQVEAERLLSDSSEATEAEPPPFIRPAQPKNFWMDWDRALHACIRFRRHGPERTQVLQQYYLVGLDSPAQRNRLGFSAQPASASHFRRA